MQGKKSRHFEKWLDSQDSVGLFRMNDCHAESRTRGKNNGKKFRFSLLNTKETLKWKEKKRQPKTALCKKSDLHVHMWTDVVCHSTATNPFALTFIDRNQCRCPRKYRARWLDKAPSFPRKYCFNDYLLAATTLLFLSSKAFSFFLFRRGETNRTIWELTKFFKQILARHVFLWCSLY